MYRALVLSLVLSMLLSCGGSGGDGPAPEPSLSADASLSSLVPSIGSLAPAFDSDHTEYTVGPSLLSGSVRLLPTTTDLNATVRIDGVPVASGVESGDIELAAGLTTVDVSVMAEDGETTRTYVVVLHRALAPLEVRLKASNATPYDHFGCSVAIDGDTLVVGATQEQGDGSSEDDNSVDYAGAAYVFVRSGSTWVQQAYLKASSPGESDSFGWAVAISGDTVVVGTPNEDSDGSSEADDSAPEAGAAYVFVRSGTTWAQQAYLKASNAEAGDAFGESVGVWNDTIVVGANSEYSDGSGEADNSARLAGAAYVFVRTGSDWAQQTYLKASNTGAGQLFGSSVAISDDTIVVGAMTESSDGSSPENNSALRSGAVYVFGREGTSWAEQAFLKASNVESDDRFGHSVAISGGTLVVGAIFEDGDGSMEGDNSETFAGAAYVFVRSGTTWSQQAYLKASNADAQDLFGHAVAVHGDAVVVAALQERGNGSSEADNSFDRAGAAYLFLRTGTTWVQSRYLKSAVVGERDFFGHGVGIWGDTVAVGALGEGDESPTISETGAGACFLFR